MGLSSKIPPGPWGSLRGSETSACSESNQTSRHTRFQTPSPARHGQHQVDLGDAGPEGGDSPWRFRLFPPDISLLDSHSSNHTPYPEPVVLHPRCIGRASYDAASHSIKEGPMYYHAPHLNLATPSVALPCGIPTRSIDLPAPWGLRDQSSPRPGSPRPGAFRSQAILS